ncbi:MAG: pyridoxal phosphate-dependent aminotransferase [Bacteroidota bacterium]
MPALSRRGEHMTFSPIRSLIPYAREAKSKGVHVHHLNIGQPDIETSPIALERLREYDQRIIKYGASEGNQELREVVSAYYTKHVAAVTADDIYVTTGASEAISFVLFSCFEPGQEIIIPEPFYANYMGFAHVSGVVLRPVESRIEDSFGLPSPQSFVEKITQQTKAIFLCNPGNPTGNLYTKEDIIAIGALVREHNLFLIVDEVYREFCYDQEFYSVLQLEGLEEHIIVIDSVSKVFSSCGSRIGFIVTRSEPLKLSILKYAQLRLCPPMIGQHLAIACFEHRDTYIADVRREYDSRRNYLYHRLSQIQDVVCYKPKAAFYNMTQLPVEDTRHFCQWLLESFELEGETLMLAPGPGFYLSNHMGRDQVRIAFVRGRSDLEKAMNILERGLQVYNA